MVSIDLRRPALAAALVASILGAAPARADPDMFALYELVDKSRLTFARFASRPDMSWFRHRLKDVQGIMIVPSMSEASLFIGAAWGTAVLLAKDPGVRGAHPADAAHPRELEAALVDIRGVTANPDEDRVAPVDVGLQSELAYAFNHPGHVVAAGRRVHENDHLRSTGGCDVAVSSQSG